MASYSEISDFVDSLEPDMRYDGIDGIVNMVTESAENMAIIDGYMAVLEESDDATEKGNPGAVDDKTNKNSKSVFRPSSTSDKKGSIIGMVGAPVRKLWNLLVNFVKKVIEKIKGFFSKLRAKITMAAAKAFKKIALFVSKHALNNKNSATIHFKSVNSSKFNNLNTIISVDSIENTINTKVNTLATYYDNNGKITADGKSYKQNNDQKGALDKSVSDVAEQIIKDQAKDTGITYGDFISNVRDYIIDKNEDSVIDFNNPKSDFKAAINKEVFKTMDTAYKSALKTSSKLLKIIDKASKKYSEKSIFKEYKTYTNAACSILIKYAQAIASTMLTVYKSLASAAISAIGQKASTSEKKEDETTGYKSESTSLFEEAIDCMR